MAAGGYPGAVVYEEYFYPLADRAPLMDGGGEVTQRVFPAGMLSVPSGRLIAVDPITGEDVSPAVAVPPGTYPVVATVAQVPVRGGGVKQQLSYVSVLVGPQLGRRIHKLSRGIAIEEAVVAFADEGAWDAHGHEVVGEVPIPRGEKQWGWPLRLGQTHALAVRFSWQIGYGRILLDRTAAGGVDGGAPRRGGRG